LLAEEPAHSHHGYGDEAAVLKKFLARFIRRDGELAGV
jgi:hypothetical protein